MQIDGISAIPPIGSISPAQQPDGPVARAATPPAAAAATPTQPVSTKPESSTPSTPSNSKGGSPRGGTAGSAPATATDAASLIAAVYATTVDGKTYVGSVEESGGEYVASVPGLPSASGDTVDAAEIALGSIIDAIV